MCTQMTSVLSANCTCSGIEEVSQYKYLGLIIDTNFSWKIHINVLCNKLRIILAKFFQFKYVVNRHTLYCVYYALVDAITDYGLSCYELTFSTYLQQIKQLQIRILKLLVDNKTKKKLNGEYTELFKICKVMPVDSKTKYLILLEQFDNDDYKKPNQSSRSNRTTKKDKFLKCRVSNYYGERTRKWLTPRLFNELPDLNCKQGSLFDCSSKSIFKGRLRKNFLG